jgi:hypothetical protein
MPVTSGRFEKISSDRQSLNVANCQRTLQAFFGSSRKIVAGLMQMGNQASQRMVGTGELGCHESGIGTDCVVSKQVVGWDRG